MELVEGETLEALENLDVSISRAWTEACVAQGKDIWDDPEEPDSWLRGWRLTDRRYVRCEFWTITLLPPGGMHRGTTREFPEHFEDRPTLRNVVFERCRSSNKEARATGAVLDEVTFVDFKGDIHLDLCALRHVRLVGRFPQLYVNRNVSLDRERGHPHRIRHIERVDEQNRRFHDDADWVLDISQATVREMDIFELPSAKVRIDPTRQAFVSAPMLEPARPWIEAQADDLNLAWQIIRHLDRHPSRPLLIATKPRGPQEAAEAALIERLHADGLALPTAPPDPS